MTTITVTDKSTGAKVPLTQLRHRVLKAQGALLNYYPDTPMEWPTSSRITDAELIALAAIANNEAVIMAGDNQNRAYRQEPAAWSNGNGYMEATEKLRIELYNRGILS